MRRATAVTSASRYSTVPTGTGRTKSVSSRPVTAMVRSSQFSEPSVSSSARGEHAAVGEAGGALVGRPHGELGGDAHALSGPGREVQSVGLFAAAAETLFVVGTEELAGRGRVGVAHGRHGVGGGLSELRKYHSQPQTLPASRPSTDTMPSLVPCSFPPPRTKNASRPPAPGG